MELYQEWYTQGPHINEAVWHSFVITECGLITPVEYYTVEQGSGVLEDGIHFYHLWDPWSLEVTGTHEIWTATGLSLDYANFVLLHELAHALQLEGVGYTDFYNEYDHREGAGELEQEADQFAEDFCRTVKLFNGLV